MTHASPFQSQPAKPPSRAGHRATVGPATWLLFVVGWLIGLSQVGQAQTSLSEYQVKALFLFNFAKYVEWPAEAFSGPSASITIGILGASPCAQHLKKAVEGKTISGRSIVVRQI